MEVPAARLEDGLQLRDLLAQLVMPRVAGRTGGAGAPAGAQSELAALPPPALSTTAPFTDPEPGSARTARRPASRRPRGAAQMHAEARPQTKPQTKPQTRPQTKPQTKPSSRTARSDIAAAIAAATSRESGRGPVGTDAALALPLLSASQTDTAARDLVRGASQSLDQLLAGRHGSRAAIAEAILAPVARRLGVLWEEDDASFAEVSAALGLLSRRFAGLPAPASHAQPQAQVTGIGARGAILLVAAPGDTHVFGLSVVGAAFEEAGWTVMCHPAASRAEIIEQVASRWIDVLAITVSWTDAMRSVPDLVAAARLASLNPDLRVLAGGGAVAQLDDACATLHADAVAVSAVQAVAVAQQMLPSRATPV